MTVTEMAVAAFLKIGMATFDPTSILPASPACPPEPSAIGTSDFPLASTNAFAKFGATLVLALPIFGAVDLPVLAEVRGERLGEENELDEVAPRRDILFCILLPVFNLPMARRAVIQVILLLLRMVDVVVGGPASLTSPQATREGHHEGSPAKQLNPPRTPYDNNLRIHTAQTAIRNIDPASRPPYAALPLSDRVEQNSREDTRSETEHLCHIDKPVLRATNLAIFSWIQKL